MGNCLILRHCFLNLAEKRPSALEKLEHGVASLEHADAVPDTLALMEEQVQPYLSLDS